VMKELHLVTGEIANWGLQLKYSKQADDIQ